MIRQYISPSVMRLLKCPGRRAEDSVLLWCLPLAGILLVGLEHILDLPRLWRRIVGVTIPHDLTRDLNGIMGAALGRHGGMRENVWG